MSDTTKRLVIDLDGTLCTLRRPGESYHDVRPFQGEIDVLNRLVDDGWHVTVFTARGMDTYGGDVRKIKLMLEAPTRAWLRRHGVRYHRLKFGKPPADWYVDDKSLRSLLP
jgi:capsule biosynthesis phosphatase